jgi:glyoxylase I family protein
MPLRGPLDHVDLAVADLRRSIAFYGPVLEYLGFERVAAAPDRGLWVLTEESGRVFEIEIRPATRAGSHVRGAPGLDHLAFCAASRSDVDGLGKILLELGADVTDPPAEYGYTPGYYAVGFSDPDGHHVEVVYQPAHNP